MFGPLRRISLAGSQSSVSKNLAQAAETFKKLFPREPLSTIRIVRPKKAPNRNIWYFSRTKKKLDWVLSNSVNEVVTSDPLLKNLSSPLNYWLLSARLEGSIALAHFLLNSEGDKLWDVFQFHVYYN